VKTKHGGIVGVHANANKSSARIPLGPELQFLRRLWRLNRALALVSSRTARELGITAQQRMIIRCVGRFPSMTAGQLATELHLDRGTVSAAVARLERRGLVRRARDPKDRRRVALGLTAAGRALDHPRGDTLESVVAGLVATSEPAAIAGAQEFLDALTAKLEECSRLESLASGARSE
jgi:DNA-binding MarR family transcriptional regulator